MYWQPDFELPEVINAGEVFEFSSKYPLKSVYINGTALSKISPLRKYWGIADLYAGDRLEVYGEYFSRKTNFITQHFSHSIEYIFKKQLLVRKTPLKKANKLRISASTWSKMDDKFTQLKKQQSQIMREILSQVSGSTTSFCLTPPLVSKVVSKYASPRTLPNGRSYYHSGVDLRARTGTAIKSVGKGIVRFADHMIVPGNMVVLDHGAGLFSRYMHLSKPLVKPGDVVEAGETIALSGATGRVEAPHLHWEISWKGISAHPHRTVASLSKYCKK